MRAPEGEQAGEEPLAAKARHPTARRPEQYAGDRGKSGAAGSNGKAGKVYVIQD